MRNLSYISGVAILAATATLALAQQAQQPQPAQTQTQTLTPTAAPAAEAVDAGGVTWRVAGGASHFFRTNINHGGNFSENRYGVSLGASYPVGDSLKFDHTLTYDREEYDFQKLDGFAPWGNVDFLTYNGMVTDKLNDDWSIFGGGLVGFACEQDGEWSDAVRYGGMGGAKYQVSKDCMIGLGVAVVRNIEKTQVAPVLLLNWKLDEQWTLKNAAARPGLFSGTGVEATYTIDSQWDCGAGALYQCERFRLDNNGDNADLSKGVGQNRSVPVYARISYHPAKEWTLSGLAGGVFGGELRLEDNTGDKLVSEDYNATPFVGVAVAWSH